MTILTAVFSLVFSPVFKDSHHFSSLWWQSFKTALKTAITSAELWAVFDDKLLRQPSLQQNFGQSLMTIFKDSHHFSRTLGDVWWPALMTILQDSHHFSRTLGDAWWQSLMTVFNDNASWKNPSRPLSGTKENLRKPSELRLMRKFPNVKMKLRLNCWQDLI